MPRLPLVSIVTPSYNQGRFIRETIESVLSQDYPHTEYMVIDGGSTDTTVAVLRGYGQRFFWTSEPDRGQAHAVNKGWMMARGEVWGWLNSDDLYLPGAVGNAVDYLISHPDVGMVYGEAYHVSEEGTIIERYPTEPFDASRLGDTCYICQPTVFIRRTVVEDVGFLDESLNYCMDYDLWIRIAKRYRIGYVREYLAQSRLYADCKTVHQSVARAREALDMLYRHYRVVPPLKVGGYARAVLESRLSHVMGIPRRIFYLLGMAALCCREFLRYNSRMPLSEFRRWRRGLREGMKKFFEIQ